MLQIRIKFNEKLFDFSKHCSLQKFWKFVNFSLLGHVNEHEKIEIYYRIVFKYFFKFLASLQTLTKIKNKSFETLGKSCETQTSCHLNFSMFSFVELLMRHKTRKNTLEN